MEPAGSSPTAIHAIVERCRAGGYPPTVAKVDAGWVIMGGRQVLCGYCLLLPDPVVADLNALEGERRSAFLLQMGAIGDALLVVTGATRINYAIFGNVEPALHAHIFPRQVSEPDATRTAQPWALDWDSAPVYTDAEYGAIKRALRARLQATR